MTTTDEQIAADLERDEGRVAHVYLDSLGFQTIAVGHMVDERKGGGLPDLIITLLRDWDIEQAKIRLDARLPWWRTKSESVQRGLVNMEFQLGEHLLAFKKMLAAIQADDFVTARAEGKDSLWFNETPVRAERVLDLWRS